MVAREFLDLSEGRFS